MKAKFKTLSLALCLLIVCTLTVNAKFWGRGKTSEISYSQGACLYIEKCYNYYVFWIRVDSWCESTLIACEY